MGLLTVSRDFYPGCELPIRLQTTAAVASDLGRGGCFRLASALRHDTQASSQFRDRCLMQSLSS